MASFDCPTISWVPSNPKESAYVMSWDRTRKAKTRSILNSYLLGMEPDLLCMEYKINYNEFCVAVLYELMERKRMIRQHESFRKEIIDWASFAISQMSNHEPIAWPPPSVAEYKRKAKL